MAKKLAKSAVSQKRVLDAAAKIFRDYGYAGTTMRTIADEADLRAGSIYYHYKSKDELISAVLDHSIRLLIEDVKGALDGLPEGATGRDKVQAAMYAHLSSIVTNGDYTLSSRRVIGQVPETIRNQNMRLRDSYAALWQDILKGAQASGEFRASANMSLVRLFVLGALNWTVEWFKPGGRSIEEVANEFTDLILDGLSDKSVADGNVAAAKPKMRAQAPSRVV